MITRHFLDVDGRRVHYRAAGTGPALLMLHQSPRSSAEYVPLMTRWSEHFTCIAPDMPGFGLSDPLPGEPEIGDYGAWTLALLDALGLDSVAAYGFHSGAIVLMNAVVRAPGRFTAIGCGGYAVWTAADMALLGDRYTPQVLPSAYGEHLTWLWHRVMEQSWFFPWYDARDAARLPGANDDPARVDAVVRDMLDAGDGWRAGYGAVLRAPRDLPPADAVMPPVLIAAYAGDPLQDHIDRLGPLPAGWRAAKVATPADLETAMLEHLRTYPAPAAATLPEVADAGFVHIAAGGFDGLIHWRGTRGDGAKLWGHAPGDALDLIDPGPFIAMDMPGHGLSDDWSHAAPETWQPWADVMAATARALGCEVGGCVWREIEDPEREFPDLTPDRFGHYLGTAWSVVRARRLFDPWYEATAANARDIDDRFSVPRLVLEHRALLRARSARAYAAASKEKR